MNYSEHIVKINRGPSVGAVIHRNSSGVFHVCDDDIYKSVTLQYNRELLFLGLVITQFKSITFNVQKYILNNILLINNKQSCPLGKM